MRTAGLSPQAWLNRLASSYPESAHLLDGLPGASDGDESLLKALSERFEAFDARLGDVTSTETSPSGIRVARTLLGSLKKFRVPVISPTLLQQAAIRRYEANNLKARENHIPKRFAGLMRTVIRKWLSHYGDTYATTDPTFSGGAVAEKLAVPDRWNRIFEDNTSGYDPTDPGNLASGPWPVALERGNCCRLCAVPKDWNKMRLITVEPYQNSYLQHYARRRLLGALALGGSADLRCLAMPKRRDPQMRHRQLASTGSVDGSFATLDLSDASDMVSYDQVAAVFPAEVMADLDRSRSVSYRIQGQEPRPVYMYAGMGNATTFSVETIMFHAACHAVAEYHRLPYRDRFISVFGDDIVVGPKLASLLVETGIFSEFGWTINKNKSYYDERTRFRESCGIQAFKGQDVTLLRYLGNYGGLGGIPAVVDLLFRCATTWEFIPLVAQPWSEVDLPNSTEYSAEGALITSIPWWPNTCRADSRYNRCYQRVEMKLPQLHIPSKVVTHTRIGCVYGALSGQLKWKTGSRRYHGRKYHGILSEMPRLARVEDRWSSIENSPWMPL